MLGTGSESARPPRRRLLPALLSLSALLARLLPPSAAAAVSRSSLLPLLFHARAARPAGGMPSWVPTAPLPGEAANLPRTPSYEQDTTLLCVKPLLPPVNNKKDCDPAMRCCMLLCCCDAAACA
jgi:hypothetical protein